MTLKRPFAARFLLLLAAIAGLGAYAILNAGTYLTSPGQEPVRADAAFVLGGSSGDRELQAAELYTRGLVKTFVVTGMEEAIPEVELIEHHWRAYLLKRVGVPAEAIVTDSVSSNSDDEAELGLRLARTRGWKTVLVLSDPPHLRRLSIIWGRVFAGSGITVRYVASKPRWWVPDRWWTSRKSAQFIVTEYIKLAYTLL